MLLSGRSHLPPIASACRHSGSRPSNLSGAERQRAFDRGFPQRWRRESDDDVDAGGVARRRPTRFAIGKLRTRALRILHISGGVSPEIGGPIEGIIRQALVWRTMDHECEIVSLDMPRDPWVVACPIKVHALGIRSRFYQRWRSLLPWLRYGYTPHLVPWLRQHGGEYDAVIINGLWNYTTLGALRALKGGPVPYFIFTHGMTDPWFCKTYPIKHVFKQIFWWFVEGPLMHGACSVLFTTEEEKILARNAFWPYQVRETVVGYGTADVVGDPKAQIAAFRSHMPGLGRRHFLLFLGRIHPKKGCDILIRAFARIACVNSDTDLVIAGPDQIGWRPELERIAHDEGVAARIHWAGMLSGDVKWGAYQAADAFVLPSHSENFGVAVAEALACNLPVLITDKINIWREVAAGGGGLVAHDDVDDFARIIRRFIEMSKEEKEQMAARARNVFVKHFDVKVVAANLLEFITRLKKTDGRMRKFDSRC